MKYDDISELPPRYQEQVRRKLAGTAPKVCITDETPVQEPKAAAPKRPKYQNRQVTVDGIRFASKREARRFLVLREMERRGEITDLRLQQNFTLIEGFTRPNGERVKPEVYKADFAYWRWDAAGEHIYYIVEDAKGYRTEKYRIKRKQVLDKYGVEIREV